MQGGHLGQKATTVAAPLQEKLAKMLAASNGMRTIEKINRIMCLEEKTETGELQEKVDAASSRVERDPPRERAPASAPKN